MTCWNPYTLPTRRPAKRENPLLFGLLLFAIIVLASGIEWAYRMLAVGVRP